MDCFDVICIGVVLMDLPLGPLNEKVFCEETTMVQDISLTTGGDALNEAVILSRLGKKVALIGHIGTDMLGTVIVKRCEEEGINHSSLRKDTQVSTRINVVLIREDGQRHFIKNHNAGSRSFRMEEINYQVIGQSKAISLASIFSSKLRDYDVILKILKTAKAHQVITFADMVPMTGGETLKDIAHLLPYLDYFFPNREEAAMLTGEEDPDKMADCLLEYGVENIIIKLGQEGCLIKNLHERFAVPAISVNAIDTTGAGDNFVAGFITAVLDHKGLEACGTFANAVAGVSTESVGATAGVKNKMQIEAYEKSKWE